MHTGVLRGDPGITQGRQQEIDLGRLDGSLTTLDGDQASACGLRAQCRLPQIRWAATMAMRPNGPIRSTLAAAMRGVSTCAISGAVTTTLPIAWPFLTGAGTGLSKETATFMSLRDLRGSVTTRSLATVSGTFASAPSHNSASSTF